MIVACGTSSGTIDLIDLLAGHPLLNITHPPPTSTTSGGGGSRVVDVRQLLPHPILLSLHHDGSAFIDWLYSSTTTSSSGGGSSLHAVTMAITIPHRPFTPTALLTSHHDPTTFALSYDNEVLILTLPSPPPTTTPTTTTTTTTQEPVLVADVDLSLLEEEGRGNEGRREGGRGLYPYPSSSYLAAFSGASSSSLLYVHNRRREEGGGARIGVQPFAPLWVSSSGGGGGEGIVVVVVVVIVKVVIVVVWVMPPHDMIMMIMDGDDDDDDDTRPPPPAPPLPPPLPDDDASLTTTLFSPISFLHPTIHPKTGRGG